MNAVMTIEQSGATPLALDLPKGQPFEDWLELGERLCKTERVLNWWIGDWWAAGHHRYGERAKVAAEGLFGKEFGSLMNAASVCRAFETSRRREALSWSHHVEVASLPTDEADALLDRARDEGLSHRNLRVEAMKRKVALGLIKPRYEADPDPEYDGHVNIGRSYNREPLSSRILHAQALEENGAIRIVDEAKLGIDISL